MAEVEFLDEEIGQGQPLTSGITTSEQERHARNIELSLALKKPETSLIQSTERLIEEPIRLIETIADGDGSQYSGIGELEFTLYMSERNKKLAPLGWFGSFYPGSIEAKNSWPTEIYWYMFKWAICLGFGLATMIVCYILTGTGVFGAHDIFTTNLLQGGFGIHMTTTVGNVPIGYLIGSAWAVLCIIGIAFFLFPRLFFEYVLNGVNMRFDWAFGISWTACLWLISFVLVSIIGASDVFVCLLTSTVFTLAIAILTLGVPYMTSRAYEVIGASFSRPAKVFYGNTNVELTVPTGLFSMAHYAPMATNNRSKYQNIKAAEVSQAYVTAQVADLIVKNEVENGQVLYGSGKYILNPNIPEHETILNRLTPGQQDQYPTSTIEEGENVEEVINVSYAQNIARAKIELRDDLQHVLFPNAVPFMISAFLIILGLVEYFGYWWANEIAQSWSYPWPIYVVYWIFFAYLLVHYLFSVGYLGFWNTESKALRESRRTKDNRHFLAIPSFWYHFVYNFGNLIVMQLLTWFIVAGLSNDGVLYYAP